MKVVNIFLLIIALILRIMSCEPIPGPGGSLTYALNISSTVGGCVTVTINGEETVIGPGETETMSDISAGTNVDLMASLDEGYAFVEWVGTPINGVTDPATPLNMQDNYEIIANFELIPTYELTMAANPETGGTAIDVTNASPYAEGARVNIKAEANEGYLFLNWTAPAGVFDNTNEPETIFTMPGQAVNVTANFELILTYELTMAANPVGGGTATDLTNASPYTAGAVVNIRAVANSGYRFVNWTAPAGTFGNATAAETTFTMPAQHITVTANFVAIYDLAISSTKGGSVTTPGEGTFTYDAGTVVDLVAEAKEGYRFVKWTGDVDTIANIYAAATTITTNGDYSITANFEYSFMVSAGYGHTVGLKSDGTVVAVGWNNYGQCKVDDWKDIIQVAAGGFHTVGLRSDGTVVAVGDNSYSQCKINDWKDIIQVAAGYYHTVGLRSDGTVVAVGDDSYGQCKVDDWKDIIQVTAGYAHTVGLRSDGTVVAVGDNSYGQCKVDEWDLN
jgi:hypothetical protein